MHPYPLVLYRGLPAVTHCCFYLHLKNNLPVYTLGVGRCNIKMLWSLWMEVFSVMYAPFISLFHNHTHTQRSESVIVRKFCLLCVHSPSLTLCTCMCVTLCVCDCICACMCMQLIREWLTTVISACRATLDWYWPKKVELVCTNHLPTHKMKTRNKSVKPPPPPKKKKIIQGKSHTYVCVHIPSVSVSVCVHVCVCVSTTSKRKLLGP